MIIKITNACDAGCHHCVTDSVPGGGHMREFTFTNALAFVKGIRIVQPNRKTVLISGGEPTQHPEFINYLKQALEYLNDRYVMVLTNGIRLMEDEDFRNEIERLLSTHKHLLIQITAVEGYYTRAKEIHSWFKQQVNWNKPNNYQVLLIDHYEAYQGKIDYAGRAIKNVSPNDINMDRKGTSCFNLYSALIGCDGNLIEAIEYVKNRVATSRCVPTIKYTGDITFGEYDMCSSVANVDNFRRTKIDLETVNGPCGKCVVNNKQRGSLSYINEQLRK